MSNKSSLLDRLPTGEGSESRNSLGHAFNHPGTVLHAIGNPCCRSVCRHGWKRTSLAARPVGAVGLSPAVLGSGHSNTSPDMCRPGICISAATIPSTGDFLRSQYCRSSAVRPAERIQPAYPQECGWRARKAFGLGFVGSTSTMMIPRHASGNRLCRTGVAPQHRVQLSSACSNSVSLSIGSLASSFSPSELLDSRRRQDKSSASRPSAPNRRPVRCSQTVLASCSSSFCRLHASRNRFAAGKNMPPA